MDLFRRAYAPDSLAGRVEVITLLPFSQAELTGSAQPNFIERAFQGDFPSLDHIGPGESIVNRVLTGGYPPVVTRQSSRKRSWLLSYVRAVLKREEAEFLPVMKREQLHRLVEYAATTSGQLVNLSRLASYLGVDGKTVDRWLVLLEDLFLIRRVLSWGRSDLKRQIKGPKLHFLDSGLLAVLRSVTERKLESDRKLIGPLLESFVFAELEKAKTHIESPPFISHFRNKDGLEIDFLLEREAGQTVGIEIKSSVTIRPSDFHALSRLEDAVGSRFAAGIVLHDGDRVRQYADRMWSMPYEALWES